MSHTIAVVPQRDIISQQVMVSHGINLDTFEEVTLPRQDFREFIKEHCLFDTEDQIFVLK